jgi:hypothetical protein
MNKILVSHRTLLRVATALADDRKKEKIPVVSAAQSCFERSLCLCLPPKIKNDSSKIRESRDQQFYRGKK